MKFTAQEEYGLRALLHLTRHQLSASGSASPSGEPGAEPQKASNPQKAVEPEREAAGSFLAIGEIARAEGISEQYAGRVLRLLAKADVVETVRGRSGGLRLARPADQISVAEALAALGGVLYESSTCDKFSGSNNFCVHTNDCSIRSLWSGLQLLIDAVLSRTSLFDLAHGEQSIGQWMARQVEALSASIGRESAGKQAGSKQAVSKQAAGAQVITQSEIEYVNFAESPETSSHTASSPESEFAEVEASIANPPRNSSECDETAVQSSRGLSIAEESLE